MNTYHPLDLFGSVEWSLAIAVDQVIRSCQQTESLLLSPSLEGQESM